jgi:hypothetical protein
MQFRSALGSNEPQGEPDMAVNKPVGDKARKGAVRFASA